MPKMKSRVYNPWENLQRAYEIAVLGDFKIVPISTEPLFDDFKNFVLTQFDAKYFSTEGDIYLELPKGEPTGYDIPVIEFDGDSEKLKQIRNRELGEKPTEFDGTAHEVLVKTAARRMELTATQVDKIYKIAAIIAQMDRCDKIKIEHVAEAIMYQQAKDKGALDCNTFYYCLVDDMFMDVEGAKVPLKYVSKDGKYDLEKLIKTLQSFL